MSAQPTSTLALLIDGDNVSPEDAATLIDRVEKYGTARLRRVYGDFTKANLSGWKDCLHEYSIQPVQQFANTPRKNSTDIALIIDAMELLHTGRFAGFCIASSDGDFTQLAVRIREHGVDVYGFGNCNTPKSFRTACNKFVPLNGSDPSDKKTATSASAQTTAKAKIAQNKAMIATLRTAITAVTDDSGRASLTRIGQYLKDHAPDFRKNSGSSQLHKLIEASGIADMEHAEERKNVFVRLKSASRKAA